MAAMASSSLKSLVCNSPPAYIPHQSLACCCGRAECTFLRHSQESLEGLESDVRHVASVGQALLVRHDEYVAGAEKERSRSSDTIKRLEHTNKDLSATNTRLRDENKRLEEYVEEINTAAAGSEDQIKSLEATLNSTQHEMKRWKALAIRTESLEEQLLQLETEQSILQSELVVSKEDRRRAQQKWHATQRTVRELEAQVESIERDAEMERQRHQEHVERVERQAAMQRHMEERRTMKDHSNEIISIFVQDLLQDNTNLQIRAAELEETLKRSEEEEENIQNDRISPSRLVEEPAALSHRKSLEEELRDVAENDKRHHFHIHHHNHATSSAAQSRVKQQARAGLTKKRKVVMPATNGSIPHSQPSLSQCDTPSSSVASGAEAQGHVRRWLHHSAPSQSSILSSGLSSVSCAPSTIFEHESDQENALFSRPTSSDTNLVWSPGTKPMHSARPSDDSGFFQPLSITGSVPDHPRRNLQRSPSHESMRSISGMDIHSTLPVSGKGPALRVPLRSKPSLAQMREGHDPFTAAAKLGGQYAPVSDMLRKKLEEQGKRGGGERYAPLRDTLGHRVGGWFGS